jgi:hypothetical protein
MNEKAEQLSVVQQIRDEFTMIALTALIATAAIYIYLAVDLLATAVVYLGLLLFISVVYGIITHYGPNAENSPSRRQQ